MQLNTFVSVWLVVLVGTLAFASSHSVSRSSSNGDGYFMKAGEKAIKHRVEKKEAKAKVAPILKKRVHQQVKDPFRFATAESRKGGKGGKKKKGGKGGKGGTKPVGKDPAPAPAKPKPEFRFPSDATCVMCEFVMESVLRKVKSQPAQFQPNVAESMMTDFGGSRTVSGEAVYRTYQGVQNFLETGEKEEVQFKMDSNAGTKHRKGGKGGKAGKGGKKPKKPVVIKPPKLPPLPIPPRPKPSQGGKVLQSDFDRVRADGEKNQEFEVTYKSFMDAMDDVCYHELPPTMTPVCAPLYKFGDRIVEMYLHGYDDWEMCSEVSWSCPVHFFDAEGVTPHRI